MAEPDLLGDERLASTRLRPSDWRAAERPRSASSGRSLRALPWLVALFAAVAAAALLLVPGLVEGVQQRAGVPVPAAPPAADPEVAALRARVAELEAVLRQPAPVAPAPAPAAAQPVAVGVSPAEIGRIADAQAALERRLDALVADLDAAGATGGAAAQAIAQARDFALLAAVRRSLDAGRPLGRIEPLLVRAFETRDAPAVAALVAWSRAPVSVALLAERLRDVGRAPAGAPADPGFWSGLWQRLSGLVEVRQESGLDPDLRARAARALARGDVATALAAIESVRPVPGRDPWVADARRLLAARDALERLDLMLLELPAAIPQAPAG